MLAQNRETQGKRFLSPPNWTWPMSLLRTIHGRFRSPKSSEECIFLSKRSIKRLVLKAGPRFDDKVVGHRWKLEADDNANDEETDLGVNFPIELVAVEVTGVAHLRTKAHDDMEPRTWDIESYGTVDEWRSDGRPEVVAL